MSKVLTFVAIAAVAVSAGFTAPFTAAQLHKDLYKTKPATQAVRTILLEQGSKYEPPSTHNIDNPETIQSSYRANFISYNDVNDVSGLGCEEPPCMVAARVEGPLPFRAEPKADRTYNFKPMMISREEGKPPKEIQAYWH
mmetsp:Transcript_18478/g.36149  ORF Transcript_18478/g.36149 Transcript_18478/m.36149 type:complete len:140 (+) Transcript_18478:28-447(+)|eukprot:CAMPEP_0175138924 /NCGR_PEP_ID=MMETSP0087-20121206/10614_1 /TAXON_ID=136419 /ORGANISM="Unknown Unknown, Strain D1" /LENGTH=139 /DNA_ID=CAMNT_0016421871 /DNA_START=323 /DNA_END=742 /DNA_ORIENTATION=-